MILSKDPASLAAVAGSKFTAAYTNVRMRDRILCRGKKKYTEPKAWPEVVDWDDEFSSCDEDGLDELEDPFSIFFSATSGM